MGQGHSSPSCPGSMDDSDWVILSDTQPPRLIGVEGGIGALVRFILGKRKLSSVLHRLHPIGAKAIAVQRFH